jgi:hypothetical protein
MLQMVMFVPSYVIVCVCVCVSLYVCMYIYVCVSVCLCVMIKLCERDPFGQTSHYMPRKYAGMQAAGRTQRTDTDRTEEKSRSDTYGAHKDRLQGAHAGWGDEGDTDGAFLEGHGYGYAGGRGGEGSEGGAPTVMTGLEHLSDE